MDKAKEALWTRSFVLDTLINFLVFLIYYLLIVIIAVVAKDNLHATASQAGLAVAIYIIGTDPGSERKPGEWLHAFFAGGGPVSGYPGKNLRRKGR